MRLFKGFIVVGVFLLLACASRRHSYSGADGLRGTSQAAAAVSRGTNVRTVTVDGQERSYHVFIPQELGRLKPAPVIFGFHGLASNPKQFAGVSQLNERGGSRGYVNVYPEGYKGSWHSGEDCCGEAHKQGINDVAFARAILDDLASLVRVDQRRVFATGISNGGQMAYRLACEMSDRIAAVAVDAGAMRMANCRPKRPVSVLHFHGTADKLAPYAGGASRFGQVGVGAPKTIQRWVEFNGCSAETRETYKKGAATCVTQSNCNRGTEVTFCTIEGMGHQWPGKTVLPRVLGPGTEDLDATAMLLDFFVRHPMPD